MPLMLASVRDQAEARLALDHGVGWLDVKEPAAGALGAAPVATVQDIVALAQARVPVSATLGDTWHAPATLPAAAAAMAASGVDYLKAGLAARDPGAATLAALARAVAVGVPLIVVCMAEAPPTPGDVARLAGTGIRGIMLDSARKTGPGLTELIATEQLAAFVETAHAHALLCGLAGRLRAADVAALLPLGADYLGFRGALCRAGAREQRITGRGLDEIGAALGRATTQRKKSEVA